MRINTLHKLWVILALVALVTSAAAAADAVQYELRFDKPNTHLLDVTIRANGLRGPAVEFAIPAWAPGAYGINDYAKNVQEFAASGADGRPLAWRKTDKQTWRVEIGSGTSVAVRYKLYGNTLANTSVQFNDRHAHIAGPAAWMYLVGGKERPVRLRIDVPSGWKVATGMEPSGGNSYSAADYDWFADCPLEISDFQEKTFTYGGSTYHVIVHDVIGRKEFGKFTEDTQKIVEAIVPVFSAVVGSTRPAPYDQYWFLFHIWPRSGGGLEHLDSTQINFSSDWDSTRPSGRFGTDYDLKLFVTSHEFFHAWNVKRLRPRPLGPFDYSREVHTPSLWLSEGLTSYYGELVLARAGLITPQHYLDSIADLLTSFEQEPGRKERSIEETSWDTWFRSGGGTETNLANTEYSYYDGGQVVGHLLDFAIRQATNNQKSLDDWMRLIYQRYALPKPGFEPDDVVRAATEVAGKDMSDFFRRYLSGKEPLPYETYFAYAGIHVEKKLNSNQGWIGASFVRGADGRSSIRNILPGSPAESAGLDRGDTVIAMDGKELSDTELADQIRMRGPGKTVKFTLLRAGELKEIPVVLVSDPNSTYELKPVENPTDLQKRIFESWIGKR